jgi:anti-sigma-K factor RskA
MNKDRELIHKYFDGDMAASEKEAFLRRLASEPGLKKEFEAFDFALRRVAENPRPSVPSAFTADVMKRLPPPVIPLGERIRTFLFAGRTLRWNMATALAAALFLVVSTVMVVRQPSAPPIVATPVYEQQAVSVTVRLTFYAPKAQQVSVAGDFNKWRVDSHAMTRQNGGIWTIDLSLEPGIYSYMFVLDGGKWKTDPGAETYEDDGFGNKNAIMRVRT